MQNTVTDTMLTLTRHNVSFVYYQDNIYTLTFNWFTQLVTLSNK